MAGGTVDGTMGGGITDTGGFSEAGGVTTGAVVQALRSDNNTTPKKLIWFFIEFWLQSNLAI